MQGKWVQGQLAEKCTSCCRCWPQIRIQSGKQIWGAAGRTAGLLLLTPRDPPGGNRASRSQFRWVELPYSTGMGEEREYQSMHCQLLRHPFASLNYLTLKLRVGRSQFTNKRLPTLLQDSLYVTKAFLLSSVELAVFLARKITKIWDYFFCLTLCFQMTQGPEITWSLKAVWSLWLLCYLNRIWNACDIKSCKSYLKAGWQKFCRA